LLRSRRWTVRLLTPKRIASSEIVSNVVHASTVARSLPIRKCSLLLILSGHMFAEPWASLCSMSSSDTKDLRPASSAKRAAACLANVGSRSIRTARLPAVRAATPVVPAPANGSRINPAGGE